MRIYNYTEEIRSHANNYHKQRNSEMSLAHYTVITNTCNTSLHWEQSNIRCLHTMKESCLHGTF